MRSDQELYDLILNTAQNDDRIRAVIMNGSRVNPNASPDIFQDFDIVYIVADVAPFQNNLTWIKRFGEMMILQMPENMTDPPPANDGCFVYLMQFMDGHRLDLTLYPLEKLDEMERDSLSLLLLDKDGLIEPFPPANDGDYLPQPPTAKEFADCCNEFWWLAPYVAKGLWRKEIVYARQMLDEAMRSQLMKMLRWYIGLKTDFARDPGKMGKYFQRYLEPELWATLLETYAAAGYDESWDALFAMSRLFRQTALAVAGHFSFDYPHGDDGRVSAHLKHVQRLPSDAKEIYPG